MKFIELELKILYPLYSGVFNIFHTLFHIVMLINMWNSWKNPYKSRVVRQKKG